MVLDQYPEARESLTGEFKSLHKLRIGEYQAIYTKIDILSILGIRHQNKVYE
ncbi:MAG TPA: hypothetical protein VIH27_03695 [Nitrososphaerales archaeon]